MTLVIFLFPYTGNEGLCILLRRLCYPNRLVDLVKIFNRDPTVISRIFQWTLNHVYENFKHLVDSLKHKWINDGTLQQFEKVPHFSTFIFTMMCHILAHSYL